MGRHLGPAPPTAPAPTARTSATPVRLRCSRLLRRNACLFRFLLWSHAYIKVPLTDANAMGIMRSPELLYCFRVRFRVSFWL